MKPHQHLLNRMKLGIMLIALTPRVGLLVDRCNRGQERPLRDERDWVVGILAYAYEKATPSHHRATYFVAISEWLQRQTERKLASKGISGPAPATAAQRKQ